MKTSSFFLSIIAAAACAVPALSTRAAVVWDMQTPSAPGIWAEFAKEGIATDNTGASYAAGYQNANSIGGADAIIVKRNAAGAVLATALFHPVVGDSYWFTGVAVDGAATTLVATGTHYNAATKKFEWFAQRFNPATLAPYAGWLGGKYFAPATVGRAADVNSHGGRILITPNGVYASGSTDSAIAMVRLLPATGALNAAWPVSGVQPAGVRFIPGTAVAVHPVPGNNGGIYGKLPQSFIEVQGVNIVLAGSLDRGAGTGFDAVANSYVQAGVGGLNWSVFYTNGANSEFMKAIAVGTLGVYAVGDTVGGTTNGFLCGWTVGGGALAGVPVVGVAGTNHNDVEVLNTGGFDHIYVAGRAVGGGIALHYQNPAAAVAVGAAWASAPFGVGATDQAIDLTVGNSGVYVNAVYVTGSFYDTTTPGQETAMMKVTAGGVATMNHSLFRKPFAAGNGALYNSAIMTVLTTGNGIDGAGNAVPEHARFAP